MQILWISLNKTLGGAELSMAEGVAGLAARGHDVHVVLRSDGPLRERLDAAASVHVVWHNNWMTHPGGLKLTDRIRGTAYNAGVASRNIARIARSVGAQVIVSNTVLVSAGAMASIAARTPHVWFLHEYGVEDHGVDFQFGRRASLAFMNRTTQAVLVNSDTLRTHFARWLPEAKLHRVHYAVDIPDLPLNGGRTGDSRYRLVLVGRRTASKGGLNAIEATARLAADGLDAELELIGGGQDAFDQQLRETARALGIEHRVHLVDPHPGHLARVAAADVALMCSRSEAFGRVTIEAMKLGKPVVGAAGGATPEIIRHGWNGYLYAPGDSGELAHWIGQLAQDPSGAAEMGQRGRAWAAETFSSERFARDLEEALESVVARSPSR